jgi:glycine dehydrogenase subunit 1
MGDAGLATVARHSAAALQALISDLPDHVTAPAGAHYNETVLSFSDHETRQRFLQLAQADHIFAGIPLERIETGQQARHLLVTTTEMVEQDDINRYLSALGASK